jgi:8-oxo-dGTP diphosphatase
MVIATLCFLVREKMVCLGIKKRGFGKYKYNGFGGKVGDKDEFKNETIEESLKREGKEEFSIEVRAVTKIGELEFVFPQNPGWRQLVHVYKCTEWDGEPKEGEEMKPYWFKFSEIPYDNMWDDDKYWLPTILEGKSIKGKFEFDKDGQVTKYKILPFTNKKSQK